MRRALQIVLLLTLATLAYMLTPTPPPHAGVTCGLIPLKLATNRHGFTAAPCAGEMSRFMLSVPGWSSPGSSPLALMP